MPAGGHTCLTLDDVLLRDLAVRDSEGFLDQAESRERRSFMIAVPRFLDSPEDPYECLNGGDSPGPC